MALIPGTLPNDTCYGTPQDLLELFAQYLDVPAFALSSKVVFSTTNTGFTSDIVWFDTTSATRPIMKITVSSSGFLDYVKNYVTNASVVTIVGADSVLILDASDSGNTKRGLVSDIVALAVPAAGSITPAQLSQPFTLVTAVPTTSGTAIDFTGIPSWVKRITINFERVLLSTVDDHLIQIGAASFATSGYESGSGVSFSSNGFVIRSQGAGYAVSGIMVLATLGGNLWASSHSVLSKAGVNTNAGGGMIPLSGTLQRVRITSTGTSTFSSGSVNILYE